MRIVVAGVLTRDDGTVLFVQRPPTSKHFAGCWEIPGGKVEPGESGPQALVRELREELGVDVPQPGEDMLLCRTLVHLGGTSVIRLDAYRVDEWNGTVRCIEGQSELRWLPPADAQALPLTPGTNAWIESGSA